MLAMRSTEPMKLTPAAPSSNSRGFARLTLVLGTLGTLTELTGHLHQPRLALFVFTFIVGLAGVGRVARSADRRNLMHRRMAPASTRFGVQHG